MSITTYATVADVEALTRARKLGQGNNPTADDVKVYLELSTAEINAVIVQKGYQAPVVESQAPQAFAYLRRLNAQGAVAQLELSSGTGPNIDRAIQVYQDNLQRLAAAETVMDAPLETERARPRGPGVTTAPTKFGAGEVFDPNQVYPTPGVSTNSTAPMFSRDLQF